VDGEERFVRSAAWLFLTGGLLTLLTAWLPDNRLHNPDAIDALGLAALSVGLLVWLLPWERWPRPASLLLVPLAMGLVSAADAFGTGSPFTYDVFYVLVFAWIGLVHSPWTCVRLAPLAVPFYLLPALVAPAAAGQMIAGLVSTLTIGVVVGETVAWSTHETAKARAQAEHRVALLHAVASGTTGIRGLEREQVMADVVEAAVGIDLDLAGLAVFSPSRDQWLLRWPRGPLAARDEVRQPQPAQSGAPGRVRAVSAAVRQDEDAPSAGSPPWSAAGPLGLRSTVAAPVWVHGELTAVLLGASARRRLNDEDLEALSLLAAHAGRSLENASRFGREQQARRQLAEVSVRDDLTGIGNRRHARGLLAALEPGDAVVMIDLDHFKSVNDTDGHEGGDRVLQALAEYLQRGVRDADTVARYGGEEFVMVLHQVEDEGLPAVQRLCGGWRRTRPRTTFSAGVAVHRPGETSATTLARADAALYQAKRSGRDRACGAGDAIAPGPERAGRFPAPH
jgi:diguanylate cyclase (GGDEF)-like protein